VTDFETKDSGERQQWASGMQRDVQTGKPRFALIWTKRQPYDEQMLTRYAKHLARGAEKYEDRNWEEGAGEEELEYAKESLLRHVTQLISGERDEDHAAAVWFNAQAIEYFRWRIANSIVTKAPDSEQYDTPGEWEDIGYTTDGAVFEKAEQPEKPNEPPTFQEYVARATGAEQRADQVAFPIRGVAEAVKAGLGEDYQPLPDRYVTLDEVIQELGGGASINESLQLGLDRDQRTR
jgi:hypothetical protein